MIKNSFQKILHAEFPEDFQDSFKNFVYIVLLSGAFGFTIGTFEGGLQIAYTSIKVPMLMLITSLFTFPFMLITGLLVDTKSRVGFIFKVVNFALTQTALMLFALVPVMWLFIQTGDYRTNILALSASFIFAGGFAIFRTNRAFVHELKIDSGKVILLTLMWAIIYTFVAGQIWWLMRPWIGYTYQKHDLPFIRPLDDDEINNVYESIQLTGKTFYERKVLNNLQEDL